MQCHCQKISGRESIPRGSVGKVVTGTSATDLTGYFRFLLFVPLKLIFESISTFLNRIRVAITIFLLNRFGGQKVVCKFLKVINKI